MAEYLDQAVVVGRLADDLRCSFGHGS
jgi:hypothetical protein